MFSFLYSCDPRILLFSDISDAKLEISHAVYRHLVLMVHIDVHKSCSDSAKCIVHPCCDC
eukprot:m.1859 g.1859  ORF g.1859 m.1859 type:complete len:60 (-) comp1286_c0_seq1:55-234(-)